MNDALHAAASAMSARMRSMDIGAKNMVNAMTPGYVKRQVSVQSFATTLDQELNRDASMVNTLDTNAWVQGRFLKSDNPLAVALEGEGFLTVQLPGGQRGFTRNGDLMIGRDGTLQTRGGYPVLGPNGPLKVDLEGAPPHLAANGALMQGNQKAGELSLVEFQNRDALKEVSDTIWTDDGSAGEGAPDGTRAVEGYLEMPHDNAMTGMVSMMMAGHQVETAKNAMRTIDESYQKLTGPAR